MKSVIFALADSVNTYEGGKLVISGTFDRIISTDVPFTFRPFGIAIKIFGEKKDYGKSYDAELTIRKKGSNRKNIEIPINIQFKKPLRTVGLIHAVLAYNIMSINFEVFGIHVVEVHVKNVSNRKKLLASIDFLVEKGDIQYNAIPKKSTAKKRKKK
ncbi:MAG: hypothetical protein ISS71_06655 [Phycisphaerae bacterium]|nr:hypothetical protein [Phycisphaerae bacterium]